MSRIVVLDPKLTPPHVNFNNFQVEENFFICKFLGRLDEKSAAATPPDRSILLKFWPEHVLKIKTESYKVCAS